MPQPGQKTITVQEETYKKLESFAKKKNRSIASLISWFADHIDELYLPSLIKEETIKEALSQASYAFDAFLSYYKAFTKDIDLTAGIRSLFPVDIFTFREIIEMLNYEKNVENWEELSILVMNEEKKINEVIGSAKNYYEPLVRPIQSTIVSRIAMNENPEMAKNVFLSYLQVSFGEDCKFLGYVILKLERLKSAIPEAQNTIDVLHRIENEIRALMETMRKTKLGSNE